MGQSVAQADPPSESLDALLSRGDLHAAAALLHARGDLLRARELFVRLGDLQQAAAIARKQGDRFAELRFTLRCRDGEHSAQLLADLQRAGRDEWAVAAAICEEEQAWREAAMLRQRLQEFDAAQRLFARAGDHLALARLAEDQGRLRDSVLAYRQFLHSRIAIGPAAALRDEMLTAHRGCARVLSRIGEVQEAIEHLQESRRLLLPRSLDTQDRLAQVEGDLIDAFLALDEPDLARRLYAQHAAWQPAAQAAATAIEYSRRRSRSDNDWPRGAGHEAALLLGRYRLGPHLGTGSVGRVYLAEDLYSGRRVALKLLALASASSAGASTLYERFCREAAILAALRHPKLVRIESFHATAGALALEYMAGGAASQAVLPLPLSRLRRCLLDVLDALLCMHAASVLHRDVKPHNIFFDDLGGAKLGDFGIASLKDLGVTQTEGLVGTLAYMAPEQIRTGSLTVATDVYGLAVSAFQLATGELPFSGPDFIAQHLDAAPPDARQVQPQLPAPWAELLQRLLHKDPGQRSHGLERLRAEIAALPIADTVAPDPPALRTPPRPIFAAPSETEPASDLVIADEAALPMRPVQRTPYSEVFITTEARLGRTVVIERFAPGLLQSPAGTAHVAWLRHMAAVAGPGLQRIWHIHLNPADLPLPKFSDEKSSDGKTRAEVWFEYVGAQGAVDPSQLLPVEREALQRVLRRLHQSGIAHGAVATSVVREPTHLSLLLQARGPLSWTAVDANYLQLDRAPATGAIADPPDSESDLAALR